MGLKEATRLTWPTSYWPLDDGSPNAHDEMGLHDGTPHAGVRFGSLPFGQRLAPAFDGEPGSFIDVPNDPKYSHVYSNALTVCGWIYPLALDFRHVDGTDDEYIRWFEKAAGRSQDVEYIFRLYNQTNPHRHSRGSFYHFNPGGPPLFGSGSYMEYGVSANDNVPIEIGKWYFFVGEAEPYLDSADTTRGLIVWKNGVKAVRSPGDRYYAYSIHPQHGPGVLRIGGCPPMAFEGGIAHVAIWNRLLSDDEITTLWSAGQAELAANPPRALI